jgi:hypothetical protein
MFERLPAFFPRAAVIVLVALTATAGLTYAAGRNLSASTGATTSTTALPQTIVVPDVRNQAFVFAKGALEDVGLAWRVTGPVHGFAANTVVSQTPAAGTKLFDTGAPLVVVTLARNAKYRQVGESEDVSPYASTVVQRADLRAEPLPAAAKPSTRVKPAAATQQKAAAPAQAAAPTAATASKYPQVRPPAFVVAGAQREPLDEMPLPDRARALAGWLDAHPKPTDANVRHWLYQHEWIVTGAKLGWWRGADALTTLIAVDQRARSAWGLGSKSAGIARRALAEVTAKSKSK